MSLPRITQISDSDNKQSTSENKQNGDTNNNLSESTRTQITAYFHRFWYKQPLPLDMSENDMSLYIIVASIIERGNELFLRFNTWRNKISDRFSHPGWTLDDLDITFLGNIDSK